MSKPTMQDIADALSVSRITVWKALSNRPGVSDSMRAQIHQKATENVNLMYTYLPTNYKAGYVLPEPLTNGTVDGVIVLNTYSAPLLRLLSSLPIPKVFLDTVPSVPYNQLHGDLLIIEGRDLIRRDFWMLCMSMGSFQTPVFTLPGHWVFVPIMRKSVTFWTFCQPCRTVSSVPATILLISSSVILKKKG